MRRFAFLAACLASFATACPLLAQASEDSKRLMLTVDHGWVLQPDGTRRDISGMVFPATIERIVAVPFSLKRKTGPEIAKQLKAKAFDRLMKALTDPVSPLRDPGLPQNSSGPTIYNADNGGPYGYIDPEEFDDPSSLDDYTTSGGSGKKLETLEYGFHVQDQVPAFVFVNWEMFSTYNSGAPAGQSAFSGSFVDFAVLMLASDIPGTGSWKLTIDVQQANAVLPSNTIYVSQQFWQDNEQNFESRLRNVYNSGAAPTVGSSQNNFWFDWDPQNNVFANEELDVLNDGAFSNHLRILTAVDSGGGTTDTLVPFSVAFPVGFSPTGTFIDLWNADDTYVTIKRGITPNPNVAPMQIEVEGLAQATTATNLKFRVQAATTTAGSTQRTYLFNYTTNVYDLVDTRTSTSADSTFDVNITSNPARYINQSNKRVKSLITFTAIPTPNNQWNARVDQTNWIVTR